MCTEANHNETQNTTAQNSQPSKADSPAAQLTPPIYTAKLVHDITHEITTTVTVASIKEGLKWLDKSIGKNQSRLLFENGKLIYKRPHAGNTSPVTQSYTVQYYDGRNFTITNDFTVNSIEEFNKNEMYDSHNYYKYLFEDRKPISKKVGGRLPQVINDEDPIHYVGKQGKFEVVSFHEISGKERTLKEYNNFADATQELAELTLFNNEVKILLADGQPILSRNEGEIYIKTFNSQHIYDNYLNWKKAQKSAEPQQQKLIINYYNLDDLQTVVNTIEIENVEDFRYPRGIYSVAIGQIGYVFENGKPIKKRTFEQPLVDVQPDDPIFAIINQNKDVTVQNLSTVATSKPPTIQEFVTNLLNDLKNNSYTFVSGFVLEKHLKDIWPEKSEYISGYTSTKTAMFRLLELIAEWNPPAKKKRYNFTIGKKQYDFIIKAVEAVGNNPSDDTIRGINRYGNSLKILIGDWSASIRAVIAIHYKNKQWLNNGVHVNPHNSNESYEIDELDLVLI